MSSEDWEYRIGDGVLARTAGETVVLFHPETERLMALNTSGTRIWQLLTEQTTIKQIVSRLIEEYEAPPRLIEEQVGMFLSQLESEQIIHRQGEPAT